MSLLIVWLTYFDFNFNIVYFKISAKATLKQSHFAIDQLERLLRVLN